MTARAVISTNEVRDYIWYESVMPEAFAEIHECERVAGVDARRLMAEIRGL